MVEADEGDLDSDEEANQGNLSEEDGAEAKEAEGKAPSSTSSPADIPKAARTSNVSSDTLKRAAGLQLSDEEDTLQVSKKSRNAKEK